jgi:UDPglucose 6-dehydrogenase
MKIGVIGTGYVGLVTGVMLASLGHKIICIDKDKSKLEKLSNGEPIIYENGLEEKLKSAILNNMMIFTHDYSEINDCDAIFICVGTPSGSDGGANLEYVYSAIDSLIEFANNDSVIIIKSTVPPGTCKEIQKYLHTHNRKNKIASNPEFLREGSALYDFENADRIIIGGDDYSCSILEKIYEKQIKKNIPVVKSSTTTSELIKYASNSFLAVKLSFINEMSDLCEKIDADVETLSQGMGLDKRIGAMFLKAGPGYGGSCFPKDTLALSKLASDTETNLEVLNASIKSNLARYKLMADKIIGICQNAKTLTILGAAFKAGTDDVRESPAIHIMKLLIEKSIKLNVYDPIAIKNFRELKIDNTESFDNIYDASINSDGIVILTEWEEFKYLDFSKLSNIISRKIIIDLRKILDSKLVKKSSFEYYTIGQKIEQ